MLGLQSALLFHAKKRALLPRVVARTGLNCQIAKFSTQDSNKQGSETVQNLSPPTSWIENKRIPVKLRPYLHLARADKQVGTMLLMWPCIWSATLAAPMGALPDMLLLSKFAVGALVMRGAGCTINDLWDKDFDKHVERTKTRPLANGDLSVSQALGFLGVQLSAGLVVLLSLNPESILLGMASMPLVICYPLMKRYTNWPQFVLGLTFNWGALVGWTAAAPNTSSVFSQLRLSGEHWLVTVPQQVVDLSMTAASSLPEGVLQSALPLYCAGVCWTLIYDTLYGYQDRSDDRRIGLKSMALSLGDKPQLPLSALSVGMFGGLCLAGSSCGLTAPFFCGAAAMWGHSLWQIWTADLDDSRNLWQRFNSNKYSGGLLALSIAAGHF